MDKSDIIYLIEKQYRSDDIGQQVPIEKMREVFCNVSSISAAEWFNAGKNGMKPQYKITMFEPDYEGETIVQFNGKRYGVYRTYVGKNETIELYLEEKAGV